LEVDFDHKIGCHGNVPCGTEKKYFSSFIYGQSFTIVQISCNIGLVDAEIIGLIDTNHYKYLKTTVKHKPSSPARAERVR